MGCDFWWSGSCEDHGRQRRAVELYQQLNHATLLEPSNAQTTVAMARHPICGEPSAAQGAVRFDSLELSIRASRALAQAGFETVGQLAGLCAHDVVRIKDLGQKSARELVDALVDQVGIPRPNDD